jgi:apolipoprotein D and lipocalin family protein
MIDLLEKANGPRSRQYKSLVAIGAVIALMSGGVTSFGDETGEPPVPVSTVDLTRYVGKWFELAKIPNRFQKQCVGGTTAVYTLRDDGRIDVLNSCRKENGDIQEAKGLARVVDTLTNSRLEVSFFSILGIRPVWGDYWILGLGENYEYAIVGSPDRKYGWILSRTSQQPPAVLERIWAIVRDQGFDPDDFEMTAHDLQEKIGP